MKATKTKAAKNPEPPVFPQTMHRVRTRPNEGTASDPKTPKAPKRENTFSKSRDVREDRGERQAKTAKNPQTFPHGR